MDWTTLPDRYWHCYVVPQGRDKKSRNYAVLNDAAKDQIKLQIVDPWRSGKPFNVSGTIVKNRDLLEEIRIVQTDRTLEAYASEHYESMRRSGIADLATDARLLPFGKGRDYTNQLLFEELEDAAAEAAPDAGILLRLCERLPSAARVLTTRQRNKPPYVIQDEYDVQDLLHALVRGYFKYSVAEEPLGKVAGTKSGRADLALEELGVIIETKYVRGPNDQIRIVEEFAQDLLLYAQWMPLKTFIYLVYNSRDLRDPEALNKLGGNHEIAGKKYRTYVVLA